MLKLSYANSPAAVLADGALISYLDLQIRDFRAGK